MKLYYMLLEVGKLKREFSQSVLPVLSKKEVERALKGFRKRDCTYTAWNLVLMFLLQMAEKQSCRKEVGDAISNRVIRS